MTDGDRIIIQVRGVPSELWHRAKLAVLQGPAPSLSAFVIAAIEEKLAGPTRAQETKT